MVSILGLEDFICQVSKLQEPDDRIQMVPRIGACIRIETNQHFCGLIRLPTVYERDQLPFQFVLALNFCYFE